MRSTITKTGLKRNLGYTEWLFNGKVINHSIWECELDDKYRSDVESASVVDALNILGKEGWELVSRLFHGDNALCLKRPIE